MPKKGANVSLSSYDDLFSTEQSRTEGRAGTRTEIPLEELHPLRGIHSRYWTMKRWIRRWRASGHLGLLHR